jgi:GntR family transcriptional regulator
MATAWNDNAPIYRQLKERIVMMILEGSVKAGEALPSVRQVAADFQINPITVSRAYQELVDDNIIEMKRGMGMFVLKGANEKLLVSERERFLNEEWPAMLERITRLGISVQQLLGNVKSGEPS